MQNNIQNLLTAVPGSDDYKTNVSEVKNKGYSFVEPIEYTHKLEKQNADKDDRIAQLEAELNRLKKEKSIEKYKNRLSNKTKKERKMRTFSELDKDVASRLLSNHGKNMVLKFYLVTFR